ncbi:MAG: glycosyl hydrolase-related protein [Kiritimatiellia bacterium]|jgi:mannosylglycerate hydrolase
MATKKTPAGKSTTTFDAHYISGTHWDREWYRPFQEFRYLLVKLIDDLMEIMETDPRFKFFHLDGQSCVLDDYLAIRPENKERLGNLIQSGRILVGPWFTMPDLFCPGDEALLRNLLLGRRICTGWKTEPMPVGFICDMFGHPSQMPQIFAGFGLHDAVMGRGTNESDTPMFFDWEAPDGTRCFTFKLQDMQGYGAFAVPRTVMEGESVISGERPWLAREIEEAGGDEAKVLAAKERACGREIATYVNHELGRCNASTLCLMDAMDHIAPASDVSFYIRAIEGACRNVKVQHSSLPRFFQAARKTVEDAPVKKGELRDPGETRCAYRWLIPHCPSARVRVKQANDLCQNLVEKWAEPLVAFANLSGAGIPDGYLREAWRLILANHAHDTICGCSIDQVHRDTMYRYDQARILAEQLRAQALGALTAGCRDLARGDGDFTLTLVNPLPFARDEVVVFDIDLPPDWPSFRDGFNTQDVKAFVLEDAAGKEIPYQRLAFLPSTDERSRYAKFCFQSNGPFTRYTVAAQLPLPACGFASVRVRPVQHAVRRAGTLRTGPASAANEFLAIEIATNGTLALADKQTGETYPGLLLFEDRSEVGDGWFHGHSVNDEQFLSTACAAQVSCTQDGPEATAFRITVDMALPRRYDARMEKPSDDRATLRISSVVTLRRGAKVVDVETTIDNQIEDHRLRLLLPSGCAAAKTYLAHHPFDFTERSIALDPKTANWQEMEVEEKPFLGIESVGCGKRGLAFLSAGALHEGGVRDDGDRTMLVTLLRSFRKTVGTAGESDGLEIGPLVHRFALMPFAGVLPRSEALRELQRLQAGMFTRQTGPRPSGFPKMAGDAPSTFGYLEATSGKLAVSAIKPAEDGNGLILRLWNPEGTTATEKLRFWRTVKSAGMTDLRELPDSSATAAKVSGKSVAVTAGPHKIVTVRVTF